MQRYNKLLVAVIGAVATFFGLELGEEAVVQLAAAGTALLVWVVPNRA